MKAFLGQLMIENIFRQNHKYLHFSGFDFLQYFPRPEILLLEILHFEMTHLLLFTVLIAYRLFSTNHQALIILFSFFINLKTIYLFLENIRKVENLDMKSLIQVHSVSQPVQLHYHHHHWMHSHQCLVLSGFNGVRPVQRPDEGILVRLVRGNLILIIKPISLVHIASHLLPTYQDIFYSF